MQHAKLMLLGLVVAGVILFAPVSILASDLPTESAAFVQADIQNESGNFLSTLQNDNLYAGLDMQTDSVVSITAQEGGAGLYINWQSYPSEGYTLRQNENTHEQNSGFLQEYVPFSFEAGTPITLQLHSAGKPAEIQLLGVGTLPESIHVWQAPAEQADILVLPTHADDEHLFMGGVMPTYINQGGISVQVAYMVNHSGESYRQQELLNGLWEAGVRHYPIIPSFPDQFSDSLEHAKTIYNEAEILAYVEELFAQFSPQVVVGHDLNGEYGHGAHMLFAETLLQAAPQSANAPQKLYLHLYGENPLVMEVNTPLEHFGERTAFEVAEDSFAHHNSQESYFTVEQDGPYDLRLFGLAFTQVGQNSSNDMMENIIPYAEQEHQAALLAAQQAEEQAQQAAQDQAQSIPASQSLAADEQNTNQLLVFLVLIITGLILAVLITLFAHSKKQKRKYKRKH